MRSALVAATTLVALALASYACSSSDDSNPGGVDAGKTSSSSSSSSGKSNGDDDDVSTSSSSSSSSSSGDGGGTSSSGDGGSSSGAVTCKSDEVDGGDVAGSKCEGGDVHESGENCPEAKAQVLPPTTGTATTSFCGSITAGDTDFWTYTFTVDGQFSYSSNAKFSSTAPTITIITGGEEFPFGSVPAGKIKSGQAVIFKITSPNAVDYHVSFNVTKT